MTQQLLTPPITSATASDAEAISARGEEPPWLREQRQAAWRAFEAMDLPEEKDEEWRRTDVRALPLERLALTAIDVAFADRDALAAQGIVAGGLQAAAREREALVRERYGTVIDGSEWKYLALNAALWEGGAFVYVPDGVEATVPVRIAQTLARDGGAAFPRTLIIAGRNARLTVIDESRSGDGGAPALVSGAVEIIAGDGARIEYYDINLWGDGVYNFKTVRAVLGRDAAVTAMAAGIGSKLTKMRVDTEMPQPGARAELLGITFGNGSQHFDYNTLQDHRGDHTSSDLQFKSALADSASLAWYGITRIHPSAGGSDANQTSRNLLLSEHAKAAPIPILEIEAYDVSKCSHGATVGPVDQDELFYLEARAIPRAVAERMLIEGFFADVVDLVPSDAVRERVMESVLAKLGGGTERLTIEQVLGA